MEFIEAMKIKKRMCEERTCSKCPLNKLSEVKECTCTEYTLRFPKKAEEILTKWAEEHPQKTMLQDFLEKYPNAPLKKDGTPQYVCPYQLGYDKSDDCIYEDTYTCCKKCWNRPLED